MSVVCETDLGWVINHETAVAAVYQQCELNGDHKTYRLKSDMFDIRCPFMMDSQFENWRQLQRQQDGIPAWTQTRKRKRRKQAKDSEDLSVELHSHLMSAHKSLVVAARMCRYLQERQELPDNNNTAARCAANITGPGDKLAELAELWSKGGNSWYSGFDITEAGKLSNFDMFHRRLSYKGDNPCVIELDREQYLIPPSASFVMSDFDQLLENSAQSLCIAGGYDLIVVDPPWENKSVKRKRSYSWIDEESLLRLPIPDLAADGCVIVVWVTNKTRLLEFVKDELLPAWSVHHVKQWHWLKVTLTGDLVFDLNLSTKKPYETLLLGRVEKTRNNGDTDKKASEIAIERDCSTLRQEASTPGGDNSATSGDTITSGGNNSGISAHTTTGGGHSGITVDASTPRGDNSAVSAHSSTSGKDNLSTSVSTSSSEDENSAILICAGGGDNSAVSTGTSTTRGGSFTMSHDSTMSREDSHKAKKTNTTDGKETNSSVPKLVDASTEDLNQSLKLRTADIVSDLPDSRVLLSVPCSLHSKKPPIQDVLQQYLPSEPRCLELFARNLWPGWVSWGHEVLKHQHIDFYEEKT